MFLAKDKVESLRKLYHPGARVELVYMSDPYAKRPTAGDRGTVTSVDDAGTIHVNWDCGSGLGLIDGEDSFILV